MDFALEAWIEEFRYWRGTRPALRAVELKVRSGELVVITGPAGAGKTTLCYCLAGAIPHLTSGLYQGTVTVGGRDLSALRLPEMAALVGFVLQRPENQLFNLTVEEDVAFGPENLGLPPAEIRRRMGRSLALTGMQHLARRASDSLSGGEMQRAVLSTILALDPELFVLDQPAAALDPRGRREFYASLRRLNREAGKTVVLVEDRLADVLPFASRLILMDEGQIVKDAPPEAFWADEQVRCSGIRLPGTARRSYSATGGAEGTWPAVPAGAQADRAGGGPGRGNVIEVRGLSFRYRKAERWALHGIDLAFRRGEFAAIIGENGAGKTTLAKHLIGLLRPTRGQVLINGAVTGRLSTARISDQVGYLFQDPDHQLFANSVFDEVAFGLKIRKVPREQIAERVADIIERLGLWPVRECHPYTLSRGQRQRLALATLLVRRPSVLVVDEPAAGLDYRETITVMNLLAAFCATGGTVIMISHDMEMVVRHAERAIVMAGGRVLLDTATAELGTHSDILAQAAIELPDGGTGDPSLDLPSGRKSGEGVVRLIG